VKPILERSSNLEAGRDFNLIYSYERVTLGRLLHNLQYMPRIVGGLTPGCAERGAKLYENITKAEIFQTDCMTAETSKTVENAYRDVNIAFANEVALICESLGADVHEVRSYVNSLPYDPSNPDKNPYRMMLNPGAGVGGHCLPKDSWLLKYGLDAYGSKSVKPRIIIESRKTNEYMPYHMKDLITDALSQNNKKLKESKITILGLAFLEDSGDTRNTPALILYGLLSEAREVIVHDPYVKTLENVCHTVNLNEAIKDSDCLALVTKHTEYRNINLEWLRETMNTPIIVDGRNVFNKTEAREHSFTFKGIGIG
jgi:UDP-N-acetyl-D-mannosaminuronic acid dehydrogenase